MGFPTIENFDLAFIIRTKENLSNYKGNNDFTMLINSLLGLIILPNEYNVKNKRDYDFDFLRMKVNYFQKLNDIFKEKVTILFNETGQEIKQKKFFWLSNSGVEFKLNQIVLSDLLNRIRNGIAHFGIIPTKDKDIWHGVIIRNYPKFSKKYNMEIYLDQNELLEFATFIADKYINTVKKSN